MSEGRRSKVKGQKLAGQACVRDFFRGRQCEAEGQSAHWQISILSVDPRSAATQKTLSSPRVCCIGLKAEIFLMSLFLYIFIDAETHALAMTACP